jgi:hypothetical protein
MDSTRHPRNGLEIQFFGLKRSGNHAVLAWLFKQFDRPVYFLNRVTAFRDPFTYYGFSRLPNTVQTPRRRLRLRGAPVTEETKLARARRLEELRAIDKEVLAISYENLALPRLETEELMEDRDKLLGTSGNIVRMLLLRDFYNWIASRIRQWENADTDRDVDANILLWITYAKEFVGETSYLRDSNVINITYNRWVTDESYRAGLLGRLGVPVKDNSNNFVPGVGGGSSFDGVQFKDRPEEMDTGERWRYLLEDRFADATSIIRRRKDEIERYNQRIFEMTAPI